MYFVVNNITKSQIWIELVKERNHRRSTSKGLEDEIGIYKIHAEISRITDRTN